MVSSCTDQPVGAGLPANCAPRNARPDAFAGKPAPTGVE
ncbi:diguanylate cyclase [Pseudomonas protegens]|nr:diguanylate cyclase [Pseudomonas protegens]